MVKGKKKYWAYRKNWAKAKFYKAVANYHRAKLTYSNRLELKGSACQFIPQNMEVLTVPSLLAECPDWKLLRDYFLSYKLIGVSIEAVPAPVFPDAVAVTTNTGAFPLNKTYITSMPVLGIIGMYDGTTYADIAESNKSMVVNAYVPTKRYWRMSPASWDCTNSPAEQTYRVATNVHGLPPNGSMMWNLSFNFYILFKITI